MWCLWLVWWLGTATSAQTKFSVVVPPAGASFGEPFELLVSFAPAPGAGEAFDERLLLPLVVESSGVVAEAGSPVVIRRYVARCYAVGDVVLRSDPPATIAVRSCLPQPPGELEWPGDGWDLPAASRATWLLLGLLVTAAAAIAAWRWLRPSPAAAVDPAPASRWSARDELQALRLPGTEHVAIETYYRQLKAIVRRHCSERLSLPATVRTSEELVQATPCGRDRLAPCFAACDHVLFAAVVPDAPAHTVAREQAVEFVQVTESPA